MEVKTIEIYSQAEFRQWLEENHQTEKCIAIILHKRHTGKNAPTHREQIEEAICFGWIDTTVKRLDEERYLRHFVRRNEKSTWSDNTISYGKALLAAGLMSEQGIKYYKLGLAKPTHDAGIPKNPDMPDNLKAALAQNPTAQKHFDACPPSYKRAIFRWLLSAKMDVTKKKRIAKIIEKAEKGERVF